MIKTTKLFFAVNLTEILFLLHKKALGGVGRNFTNDEAQ